MTDIAAEARQALEAEPVHRLSWTCPNDCGTTLAVDRRLDRLPRGAEQLVRTVERHTCPARRACLECDRPFVGELSIDEDLSGLCLPCLHGQPG